MIKGEYIKDGIRIPGITPTSYEETRAKVAEWAAANDCSLYSDSREDFFISQGVTIAHREGRSGVIVEDLS